MIIRNNDLPREDIEGYAGGQGVLESIGTDKSFTSKYGSNGCPDRSASGMFSYCKSKGMD